VFVEGDTLFGQPFDAARLRATGPPFAIAEHVGRTSAFKSAVSASSTGTLAYAGTLSPRGTLAWFDRGGRPMGSIGPNGYYTDFRLSPDEKSLAASLLDRRTSTVEVWITDLTRGTTNRIGLPGTVLNASPIWSPDGAQFVFRTNRGTVDLYRRSAAGGGSEQNVLPYQMLRTAGIQSNSLVDTDWSPDGNSILLTIPTSPNSGTDLWCSRSRAIRSRSGF
jgi:hypothetical protein